MMMMNLIIFCVEVLCFEGAEKYRMHDTNMTKGIIDSCNGKGTYVNTRSCQKSTSKGKRSEGSTDQAAKMIKEIDDRKSEKKNLIIFGVKELGALKKQECRMHNTNIMKGIIDSCIGKTEQSRYLCQHRKISEKYFKRQKTLNKVHSSVHIMSG